MKSLLEAGATLLCAVVAVFFLIHLVPGDPAQILLGEKATPQAIESVRSELGLDRPLISQLGSFLKRVSQGDFGLSIRSGRPVFEEIKERVPATLELAIAAMILSLLLGLPLGMLASKKPGGILDTVLGAVSVLGLSLPIFFLGLLMILVFGLWLEWFPLSGRLDYSVAYNPTTGFVLLDAILQGDWQLFQVGIAHLVLPAFTLASVPLSLIARLTRAALIEAMRADFIRTARAKGQSEWVIFLRHAFRNALLPVITVTGFQFGLLLGGAILTENVFAWPGMGRWIVFSVEGRDYPAIQGSVLFFAAGIIIVMALTDFVHKLIDPRLRVHA